MRWILLLVGMLVVPWLTGCAGTAERAAERAIIQRAEALIGPADDYDADVRGLTSSSAREVMLVGTRVRPRPNLVLERLTLNLRGVHYQRDPFVVQRVEEASFVIRVTEQAINSYLLAQGRTGNAVLRNAQVALLPNEVRVAADMLLAGQTVHVTTAGSFQAQGAVVQYVPQRLAVAGVGVPLTVLPLFAALVNPAADLGNLRFTPQVETITVESGAVTLSGRADVRAMLGEVQP